MSQDETAKEAAKETVGVFFDFTIPYADDGANKVSIRVDGIECEIAKLEAPDEYSDDATPGDGMAFCRAEGTARSDGKRPLEVPDDAKAQGAYYSSDSSLDDGLVLVSVN